jgi:hypothetical protein
MACRVVDPDVPDTWPPQITDAVTRRAACLRGTTEFTSDLQAGDGWLRPLLGGCLLRAYHCTRLLDHEVAQVRSQGLRPLTDDLLRDRIEWAFAHGHISAPERALLLEDHVFATGHAENRRDQVCLAMSRQTFSWQAFGVQPLLSIWGGEGMSGRRNEHVRRSLGRPAIVVALLDLTLPGRHLFFPALENVFVGAVLGLDDVGGDVLFRSPIAADCIEQIWQPGSLEYDPFEELPRV